MADMTMAIKVLNKIHSKLKENDFAINPYSNGREVGFAIVKMGNPDWEKSKTVMFSENRNSDSLVVYVGERKWFYVGDYFTLKNNEECDIVYKNAKYFNQNDYLDEAPKYILNLLLENQDKDDEKPEDNFWFKGFKSSNFRKNKDFKN